MALFLAGIDEHITVLLKGGGAMANKVNPFTHKSD